MNIRYIPTWLGLLLTLYLVTACDRVYDDLSGCLGNTIVFSYLADDNQEHLQEYVDGIDVFIFDAKGEVLITIMASLAQQESHICIIRTSFLINHRFRPELMWLIPSFFVSM